MLTRPNYLPIQLGRKIASLDKHRPILEDLLGKLVHDFDFPIGDETVDVAEYRVKLAHLVALVVNRLWKSRERMTPRSPENTPTFAVQNWYCKPATSKSVAVFQSG